MGKWWWDVGPSMVAGQDISWWFLAPVEARELIWPSGIMPGLMRHRCDDVSLAVR